MDTKERYVFVLAHADIWGAINANKLVRGVAEESARRVTRGEGPLKPILIISHSTRTKDGSKIAIGTNPGLREIRQIKEEGLANYFQHIDTLRPPQNHRLEEPPLLTFAALAKKYCMDGVVHHIDSGGQTGGKQIEKLFAKLACNDDSTSKTGIKPDLVLSGDTLAILPASITDTYPCFGTHPGPLPQVPGMHGTLRSVIFHQLFNADGTPFHPFAGQPHPQRDKPMPVLIDHESGFVAYINRDGHLTGPHVGGTFFNLDKKLDEGAPLDYVHVPYHRTKSLVELRHDLYNALTDTMLQHLPILLDETQRKALLVQKKAEWKKRRAELPLTVPTLEQKDIDRFLNDQERALGIPIDPDDTLPEDHPHYHALRVEEPRILDPSGYKDLLTGFWPQIKPALPLALPDMEGRSAGLRTLMAFRAGEKAGRAYTQAQSLTEDSFEKTCKRCFPELGKYNRYAVEKHHMYPDGRDVVTQITRNGRLVQTLRFYNRLPDSSEGPKK